MNTLPLPTVGEASVMLRAAIGQIEFARRYTLELFESVPHDRWFEIPAGLPAPLAWHAGHLAVSQYGLLMFRIRGRRPDDLELIPSRFRKAFGRGSDPSAVASAQQTPAELLERLREVHQTALAEIADTAMEVFVEPVDMPYAAYPTKLGAVLFCPLHEQIHAGHIGLIRRSLGLDPIR